MPSANWTGLRQQRQAPPKRTTPLFFTRSSVPQPVLSWWDILACSAVRKTITTTRSPTRTHLIRSSRSSPYHRQPLASRHDVSSSPRRVLVDLSRSASPASNPPTPQLQPPPLSSHATASTPGLVKPREEEQDRLRRTLSSPVDFRLQSMVPKYDLLHGHHLPLTFASSSSGHVFPASSSHQQPECRQLTSQSSLDS